MNDYDLPARGSLRDASLADREAAIAPMLAEGWTIDAALNHVEGACDLLVCSCGIDR